MITLSVLGLLALVLVVCLNPLAIFLSVVAALLALIYPFMKRFTYFPQLVLGLAFAMPVPIAFAASVNSLPPICWLLFVIAVLWPLMYDTAYAINDQIDDAKLGLKSTALRFGAKTPLFIAILQGMLLILWAWLGGLLSFHCFFWLSLGLTALGFIYQQRLLHQNQAFAAFLNNQWIGGILWLGLVLGGF